MPINIEKGDTAEFIVEFINSNGTISVPTGGTLTITYRVGTLTASQDLALTQNGSFFTTLWGSSVADLGPATWTVTPTGGSAVESGSIRVVRIS